MFKAIFLRVAFCFLSALLIFGFPSPSLSDVTVSDPELNVEVNTDYGPGFDPDDEHTISECLYAIFSNKFPLDFLPPDFEMEDPGGGSDSESGCPSIDIFDNSFEMCYLIGIYNSVRPAITLGLFIYAIIHL